MMTAHVTLVGKYFCLQSPLKHKDFVAFELYVWETLTVWGSKGHIVCARECVFFAQQCMQPASESASGQAKGRTVHQQIHRTTECFLGGGWDSEREGSKKSFGNYLQLWACFCAISHTFLNVFFLLLLRHAMWSQLLQTLKVQRWQKKKLFKPQQIVNLCDQISAGVCVCGGSVGVGGAEAVATWAKASVIGSQFLNPDPVQVLVWLLFSEGCRIEA